jgi:hypothetical protein
MEVTRVFDFSHCLLPLVKDKMFRKVDLLTSEGKTKTSFYNVLFLVHCIELVKDRLSQEKRPKGTGFIVSYDLSNDESRMGFLKRYVL